MSTAEPTPILVQPAPPINGAVTSTPAAPTRSAQTGRENTSLGTFGVRSSQLFMLLFTFYHHY